MVITQREFHKAMQEINVAFAALSERVEVLEKKLAVKETAKPQVKKTVDNAA